MKVITSPQSAKSSAFWSIRFRRLSNLQNWPKLPFSEFRSQSNTNCLPGQPFSELARINTPQIADLYPQKESQLRKPFVMTIERLQCTLTFNHQVPKYKDMAFFSNANNEIYKELTVTLGWAELGHFTLHYVILHCALRSHVTGLSISVGYHLKSRLLKGREKVCLSLNDSNENHSKDEQKLTEVIEDDRHK